MLAPRGPILPAAILSQRGVLRRIQNLSWVRFRVFCWYQSDPGPPQANSGAVDFVAQISSSIELFCYLNNSFDFVIYFLEAWLLVTGQKFNYLVLARLMIPMILMLTWWC